MEWVEFEYGCVVGPSGTVCVCDKPDIAITFMYGDEKMTYSGLIDSGSSHTLIDMEIAEVLGIDLSGITPEIITGVGGGVEAYPHKLSMMFDRFEDTFTDIVYFVKDLKVPTLLGQNRFFEHFDVCFERSAHKFRLRRTEY